MTGRERTEKRQHHPERLTGATRRGTLRSAARANALGEEGLQGGCSR